jgi:hypothetical protein
MTLELQQGATLSGRLRPLGAAETSADQEKTPIRLAARNA